MKPTATRDPILRPSDASYLLSSVWYRLQHKTNPTIHAAVVTGTHTATTVTATDTGDGDVWWALWAVRLNAGALIGCLVVIFTSNKVTDG